MATDQANQADEPIAAPTGWKPEQNGQYLVLREDGSSYGPAGYEKLRAWAEQDRIRASTILKHVETGYHFRAYDFDLPFKPNIKYFKPGSTEIMTAWLCSAMGALVWPIALLGIWRALAARKLGNPLWRPALATTILSLVLGLTVLAKFWSAGGPNQPIPPFLKKQIEQAQKGSSSTAHPAQ